MCQPADLIVTAATDRLTYRAGQPVAITVAVRNNGESPCNVPTGSCVPQVLITDSKGTVVWNRAAIQVLCTYGNPDGLAPGATASQTVTWDGTRCAGRDPNSCPGGLVSPGPYSAEANWNTTRYGSATFLVTS